MATACGPELTEEAPPCEELRRQSVSLEELNQCAGCFSIDGDGIGTCRGVLTELDEAEMAAALAASASAADHRKTVCPERTSVLDPLASHAVERASEFESLWDLKEAMAEGPPSQDLEVRVNDGTSGEEAWGGLRVFVRISGTDPAPSCCVGPDCGGADYRCEWPASEGAPTPCTPAD